MNVKKHHIKRVLKQKKKKQNEMKKGAVIKSSFSYKNEFYIVK